jgi:hypothetical protein
VDDSQIRAMVSYVVEYLDRDCPENLETMVHFIGHDEEFRRRVEEIIEEIIDHHDALFVACSSGERIEDVTPKYAEQCKEIRKKMRELVNEYLQTVRQTPASS